MCVRPIRSKHGIDFTKKEAQNDTADKERQVREPQNVLADREKLIRELQDVIAVRERQIRELQDMMAVRERQIRKLQPGWRSESPLLLDRCDEDAGWEGGAILTNL